MVSERAKCADKEARVVLVAVLVSGILAALMKYWEED